MMMLTEHPAPCRPRHYRLVSELYLERFGDDCLLLVADRDLLLTVNAAAADLFEVSSAAFRSRTFTIMDIADWFCRHYELPAAECHRKSRELLAFGLKHHLVGPAVSEPTVSPAGEPS